MTKMDANALFKLTNGLYVLGADDNGSPVGSLIDAVSQVAHSPDIIIVSCGNNSYTKEVVDKNGMLSLSVLGKNVNPFVIANFGFQSSRNVKKWNNVEYEIKDGLPYLKDCIATLKAKVISKQVFSSNTMFAAEVVDGECHNEEEALTYADYRSGFKDKVMQSFQEYKSKLNSQK